MTERSFPGGKPEPMRAVRPGEKAPAPSHIPPLPPTDEPDKKVSRRKFLTTGAVLAGGTLVAGLGLGVKEILSGQGHPGEKFSPKPKPTSVPETPTPKPDSPEAIKSQEAVSKNIEVFFDNFSRKDLNAWAQNTKNRVGFSQVDVWRFPIWDKHSENSAFGLISYKDGLKNVPAVPALSTLKAYVIDSQYSISDYVGANLGVYEKSGNYFLALGLMPNPAFAPEISGKKVEKYVEFFNLTTYNDYSFIFVQKTNGAFFSLGTSHTINPNKDQYIKKIRDNLGFATYIQAQTKDTYRLVTLGLLGGNEKLGKAFLGIQKNEGWIQMDKGLELPSNAPFGSAGELKGSTQLLSLS